MVPDEPATYIYAYANGVPTAPIGPQHADVFTSMRSVLQQRHEITVDDVCTAYSGVRISRGKVGGREWHLL